MRAKIHLSTGSDLYDMFHGREGTIVHSSETNAHIRVELDGHDPAHPSYAVIITEWQNLDVISG